MKPQLQPIREWQDVTRERLDNEIRPLGQPAIMRGFAHDWPLVNRGRTSTAAVVEYLKSAYSNRPVGTIKAPASEKGRLFYNREINGYNFQRTMQDMRVVLNELLALESHPSPPAVTMQGLDSGFLPDLAAENLMPLVPGVEPKVWIGNASIVAPHYDLLENIAVVAVGRRRFTLFPPEQLPNLYVGPLENTPAGAPISLVDVANPDFDKFPRFAEALAHGQVAEMEPGDAIYIPYMWWHGVEALERFNILVNYWWNDRAKPWHVNPRTALMVARLAFEDMPNEHRERWRAMFDHYIFNPNDDAMAHVPPHARGMFGQLNQAAYRKIRLLLAKIIGEV